MEKHTACSARGCDHPTRWRDLCNAHAVRYHRTGERGGPVKRRGPKPFRPCGAEQCEAKYYCGGYCVRHYQQIRNRGLLEPPRLAGHDHPAWRGDAITYRSMHTRIAKARGPAALYSCVDCGQSAEQWSYDHTDPSQINSELGPYSTDEDCYQPRCIRCHLVFDRATA